MVKAGRSPSFIRCAIASQIVWLIVLNLKDVARENIRGIRARN